MRRSGSQVKHLAMKSTNSSSSHLRTVLSVLAPALRRLPLLSTTGRGAPVESVASHSRQLSSTFSWRKANLHTKE